MRSHQYLVMGFVSVDVIWKRCMAWAASIRAEILVVLEIFRAEDALFVLIEDGDEVAGSPDRDRG